MAKFPSLQLPPLPSGLLFAPNDAQGKAHIYDVVRKKQVLLTPEEWVRQHFLHYLLAAGYRKSLISLEAGTSFQRLKKRTDLLARDRQGKPFLLVECKAPTVKLSEEILQQLLTYNIALKSPYLALTNGFAHYFWHVHPQEHALKALDALPQPI